MPFAAGIHHQIYNQEEKTSLVLLHGAGGCSLSWPAEIRRMDGYRVHALDLPGHGKSGRSGYTTIDGFTHQIFEWLQELSLREVILIGHSMGGAIALSMALDKPECLKGLVLMGTGAKLPVNPILIKASAQKDTFHQGIAKIISWSFTANTPANIRSLVAKRMAETPSSVFHDDLLACNAFDVTGQIHSIQCPTLVVCGLEDRMTPFQNSQYLADTIPGAQIHGIPEAGHMVMIEKPHEVALSLARFLIG